MDAPRWLVIIPSYGQWPYVFATLQAFAAAGDPHPALVLVDDGSPDYPEDQVIAWQAGGPHRYLHRFVENGGYIRSLNQGLRQAWHLQATYTACGNSDILVAPGWHTALEAALERHDLVGPLSNAAGITAEDQQDIGAHLADYQVSDRLDAIAQTQQTLLQRFGDQTLAVSAVNGFFMAARTTSWWTGAFDADHVFQPRVDRMPSGRPNKTPLMTGNEDELQARWRKRQRTSGIALGSFVFHYRSVTRGERYCRGRWLRRAPGVA